MERKKTGILVFIALLLAAALVCLYRWQKPSADTGDKNIQISVVYKDGSEDSYTVKTDAEYLKAAAQSVLDIQGEDTPYGFSVLSINGEEADLDAGKVYWAIYVNGQYGEHSIDTQPANDGDVFLFRYETT